MRKIKIKQIVKRFLPSPLIYKYLSLCRKSYGQAGQDFWIYGEVFNKMKGGYFIEVGSNDGLTYNNTFLLESRFKWKGLCIEANPKIYQAAKQNRKVPCINACVSDSDGVAYFMSDGLDSRIIFEDEKQDVVGDDILKLDTLTLESIFHKFNVPKVIDYMSMDIEGAEWMALKHFPFKEYKFNSLTIERPNEELRSLLENEGYIIIKEIPGLDVFYIHSTFINSYQINLMNFWEISKSKLVST